MEQFGVLGTDGSARMIVSKRDLVILLAAFREAYEAIRDGDYPQRTGYERHSFLALEARLQQVYDQTPESGFKFQYDNTPVAPYAVDYTVQNIHGDRFTPIEEGVAAHFAADDSPTDVDDGWLGVVVGRRVFPEALVLFALDGLKIVSAAITECLKYFEDDDPPYNELPTRTGFQVQDFQALQSVIVSALTPQAAS